MNNFDLLRGGHLISFLLPLVALALAACATTSSPAVEVSAAPPSLATCRIFISGDDPIELEDCVESVTSDGTLILKPSAMTAVQLRLAEEQKSNGDKHLWMMLARAGSSNSIFAGPTVAYVGKGPSGVNLARQVAFFDNGPDFFSEGLARSVAKNGKIGFIDETLTTVIREEYDYATPFERGLALACNGCKSVQLKNEHSSVSGGDWLVLNKFGKILKGPGLTQVQAYEALKLLAAPSSKAARP